MPAAAQSQDSHFARNVTGICGVELSGAWDAGGDRIHFPAGVPAQPELPVSGG
jgi:hypothetical protein